MKAEKKEGEKALSPVTSDNSNVEYWIFIFAGSLIVLMALAAGAVSSKRPQ